MGKKKKYKKERQEKLNQERKTFKDEDVIVLDIIPEDFFKKKSGKKTTPILQAVGQKTLALLKLIPQKKISLKKIPDIVYIGSGKRDHIHHVEKKINHKELTQKAKEQLDIWVDVDLIENALEELFEIDYIKKNLNKKTITINVNEDNTKKDLIKENLENLGFEVVWKIKEIIYDPIRQVGSSGGLKFLRNKK